MLLILLAVLFIIPAYAAAGNGESGVLWVSIAIIVLLLLGASVSRRDRKAWNNRQNYWASGGPGRKRRK